MENVATALELGFIAQRNLVLQTTNYNLCLDKLKEILSTNYSIDNVVEIDLAAIDCNFEEMVEHMVYDGGKVHDVVVWRNLENIPKDIAKKNALLKVLNQLDQNNSLKARNEGNEETELGNCSIRRPLLFMIIPIIVNKKKMPNINPQVKNRFWFSQLYLARLKEPPFRKSSSREQVSQARLTFHKVFMNALITEYVCSLIVFTRSHRLCSLAPLTTRPTLEALDGIMDLSKALVVLQRRQEKEMGKSPPEDSGLYVIPEHVKVAYRKVGYWLVNWETNAVFEKGGSTAQKKNEVSILTGDWYGSDWAYVNDYLKKFASKRSNHSTTGYTNPIVEDVLSQVRPPI